MKKLLLLIGLVGSIAYGQNTDVKEIVKDRRDTSAFGKIANTTTDADVQVCVYPGGVETCSVALDGPSADLKVSAATGTRRVVFIGDSSTSLPGNGSSDISMLKVSSNQQSFLQFEDRSQAADSKKIAFRLYANNLEILRAINDADNANTLAFSLSNATGNFNFQSGDLTTTGSLGVGTAAPTNQKVKIVKDAADTGAALYIPRPSSDAATTAAHISIASFTSGGTDGDSFIHYGTNNTNWAVGVKQSDNDFYISNTSNLVTPADHMVITNDGDVTIPAGSLSLNRNSTNVYDPAAFDNINLSLFANTNESSQSIYYLVRDTSSVAQAIGLTGFSPANANSALAIQRTVAGTTTEMARFTTQGGGRFTFVGSNGAPSANALGAEGEIVIARSTTGSSASELHFVRDDTVTLAGEVLGAVLFSSTDSATPTVANADASIISYADGTHSGTSHGSSLELRTKATTTGPGSAATRRMGIASNGVVDVEVSLRFPNGGNDLLDHYEEVTVNSGVTWVNATAAPTGYEFNFVRNGNIVHMEVYFEFMTVSTNGTIEADQVIPTSMAPVRNSTCLVVLDGNVGVTDTVHIIDIQNDRDVVFYEGTGYASFTNGDQFRSPVSGNRYITCTWQSAS